MTEVKDEFLSKSGLKELGWTDGSIKKFLGDPDQTKPNPHYKSGLPMQLYSKHRTLDVMASEEWQAWYQKGLVRRQKQSETLNAIAGQKKAKIIEQALAELTFHPPDLTTQNQVFKAAIDDWYEERGILEAVVKPKVEDVYPDPVERWAFNMLRHSYSNYEELLWNLSGQIGHAAAYEALKAEINSRASDWLNSLQPFPTDG